MTPPVRIAVHSGRWSGDLLRPTASTALAGLNRLAGTARPGQVLVSQTCAALVEGDRSLPAPHERTDDTTTPFYELDPLESLGWMG